MSTSGTQPELLRTSAGDFPLHECRLRVGGREWAVLHTGALVTAADEESFLTERAKHLPYGVALWPSAIALAHEVAARADAFRGRAVLELGAGTGLPGIVAASLGARVVQADRQEVALHVCRLNGRRNGAPSVEYRLADWGDWADGRRYDWVLGSDVLYAEGQHAGLRRVFESNLAPAGRVLLAGPFRTASLPLLEALERDGWAVTLTRWALGEGAAARRVGVFELTPPYRGNGGEGNRGDDAP
jgi:predicted nicotinamide N-methyase